MDLSREEEIPIAGAVFGIFCVGALICALCTGGGAVAAIGQAFLSSAGDAVTLMLSLVGPMCLWSGFLEVLREMGVRLVSERLSAPLLRRLFPRAARRGEGLSEITSALCANALGLGNAATPLALCAMEKLRAGRDTPHRMSSEEILFVLLCTAPPTLLPTTLLSLRIAAGSADPTAPLPAIWAVSFGGCIFAAVLAAILNIRRRPHKKTSRCGKGVT